MTATLDTVTKKKEPADEPAELAAARALVRQAKEQGLSLTGPDGLLTQLTKPCWRPPWPRSSSTTSPPQARTARRERGQ
jgi:hypothetical protein